MNRVRHFRSIPARPATVVLAALVLVALASVVTAQPLGGVLDYLHLGSRCSLGLGGDPFLSPLSDQCGWWSRVQTGSDRLTWRQVDYQPVTRRGSGGDGELVQRLPDLVLTRRLHHRGWDLHLQGELARPRQDFAWNGQTDRMQVRGDGTVLAGGFRLGGLVPGLTLQAIAPLWRSTPGGSGADRGFGVRYAHLDWIEAQAHLSRSPHDESFLGVFSGEPVATSLNLLAEQSRYDVRLRLAPRLAAEVSYASTGLGAIQARSTAETYEFIPNGTAIQRQAGLLFEPWSGSRLLLRYTDLDLDLAARAYWGGQRFGLLKYARGTTVSRLVAWQARWGRGWRVLCDAERARMSGATYGKVDSWPFTDLLIDLLGISRSFKGDADLRWTRWHVGLEKTTRRGLLQGGVNWYDLQPEAHLKTWLPYLFGMGQQDVQYHDLTTRRIRLAAVSLGFALPVDSWLFSTRVHQFVYVSSSGADSDDGSGGQQPPPDDPPAASDDGPSGWIGGTFLSTSISVRF